MKTKDKIHLQCGYEDVCKRHECMECGFKKRKYNLNLSLAEVIVIEDFAMCDLRSMVDEKHDDIELMQNVMRKVMKKIFKGEHDGKKEI